MSQRLITCKSQDLGHLSYTPFRLSREFELHNGVEVGSPELKQQEEGLWFCKSLNILHFLKQDERSLPRGRRGWLERRKNDACK
jgi:hypothetical protein